MKEIKFKNTIIQYVVRNNYPERAEIELLNANQGSKDGHLVINDVSLNNYFFKRLLTKENLKFKLSKLRAYNNIDNNYVIYFWK